jgi:hypothetical protein
MLLIDRSCAKVGGERFVMSRKEVDMIKRVLGITLLIVLLLGLVAGLTALAPGGPPTTAQGWLVGAVPCSVVALLGVVVGLAELASTFSDYPMDAVVSAWGLGLIALNGAMAAVVFAVARVYAPDVGLFPLVLGVGIGFQALIRTKFTLAKQFSGGDGSDLSLNLGWLYEQFQSLCKTQIDQALMRRRQPMVQKLVDSFPDKMALFNIAYYTTVARRTLAPDEEARQIDELTKRLTDPSLPSEVTLLMLALHILETGGEEHARALVEAASRRAAPEAAIAKAPEMAAAVEAPDRETVTKDLAQRLGLGALKALALEVVGQKAAGDVRDDWRKYIKGTAGDTEASELVRRTSLARFIVDKAGPAFAAEKLTAVTPPQPPDP